MLITELIKVSWVLPRPSMYIISVIKNICMIELCFVKLCTTRFMGVFYTFVFFSVV